MNDRDKKLVGKTVGITLGAQVGLGLLGAIILLIIGAVYYYGKAKSPGINARGINSRNNWNGV